MFGEQLFPRKQLLGCTFFQGVFTNGYTIQSIPYLFMKRRSNHPAVEIYKFLSLQYKKSLFNEEFFQLMKMKPQFRVELYYLRRNSVTKNSIMCAVCVATSIEGLSKAYSEASQR